MAYTAENYPSYSGSTAIAGKKLLLYVAYENKWELVGGLRDTGIEISADTIDASNKGSNGWGESIAGTRSWSSSPTLVVKTENKGDAIIENWVFDENLQDEKPALHVAFVNKQTKEFYHSWCQVTSYSIDASYDDVMTKNIELAGVAPVVKGEGFIAETKDEETINPAVE